MENNKMELKDYVKLIEQSNTKGIKALMAKRKLKTVRYDADAESDKYLREFIRMYLQDVHENGYQTTVFIGLESNYLGTPGFQEWAEKLWRNECYSEFLFVRNFDWSFKLPEEPMIVSVNYNHENAQLAERKRALNMMQYYIEKHLTNAFSIELFCSDMLKVKLK